MTDITITREHVDTAVAMLTAKRDHFATQRVEEAASFERKKQRFVKVGQERATVNGIGPQFDDMMEALGFPRRPNRYGMYLRGCMYESVGAVGTSLALVNGQSTYMEATTMVVTPVFLSVMVTDVEGLTCPCEAPQEPMSRAVAASYGEERALGALLHVTGSYCESRHCVSRERGLTNSTAVSQLPALDPTKPSFAYIPVG